MRRMRYVGDLTVVIFVAVSFELGFVRKAFLAEHLLDICLIFG